MSPDIHLCAVFSKRADPAAPHHNEKNFQLTHIATTIHHVQSLLKLVVNEPESYMLVISEGSVIAV